MTMFWRCCRVAATVVFLAGWWGSQSAVAQQTHDVPDPVLQLENIPLLPSSSFHHAARFRSDGHLYLWDGTDVWRQDGVNVDGFTSIGQITGVPGGSVNMADAGPINFSRDGLRIILGNGAGGWGPFLDPPQEFHVGRIFAMSIAGETVSDPIADIDYHYDLIPLPPQSTLANPNQKYFVDYGYEDFMTDPLSWVSVLDESTGDHVIVINGIPGASAALATDNKGDLFACVGFTYGNGRGLIKRFARADVDLAYQTGTPLTWADGVPLNPDNYDNQSGAGMFFDARGFLFVGGNEGLTVFRPDGSSGTFDVGNGAYASIAYNPLNDQILAMGTQLGDLVFDIYQAGDFLPVIPGDANGDGTVDQADALILASHWGEQDGAYWVEGDFSGDGAVDAVDASILAANWGASLPAENEAAAATSAPEPNSVVGLLGALLALAGCRRLRKR